jgi:hypothetical protein
LAGRKDTSFCASAISQICPGFIIDPHRGAAARGRVRAIDREAAAGGAREAAS